MADARRRGPACFAPPLSDENLAAYETLAATADPPVRDAMLSLATMVREFRKTPDSKLPGVPLETDNTRNPFRHPETGETLPAPKVVPLEAAEVQRMDPHVPWPHELKAMSELFEAIPNSSQKPLRDAAFHLLWFGQELCLDREPMTQDKIGK